VNIDVVLKPVNKTISIVLLVLSWVPNNQLHIDLIEKKISVSQLMLSKKSTL